MTAECRPPEGTPDGTTFLLSHPNMRRPLRWVWISGAWALDRRGLHFPPAGMHEWGWRIVTPPEGGKDEEKEEEKALALHHFYDALIKTAPPALMCLGSGEEIQTALNAALAAVAPLIRAAERERCAKMLDTEIAATRAMRETAAHNGSFQGCVIATEFEQMLLSIAAAIRARKP